MSAGDGAAGLLGDGVEAVHVRGGGGPGVDGLLAGGDDVDAAQHALFHVLIDIPDEAEQRNDGHIRRAFVEYLVRIVGNDDAGLDPKAREVAHVLTDHGGVHVDGAHDLRAVLVEVTQDILAHLAAAILYDLDLFHERNLLVILLTIV